MLANSRCKLAPAKETNMSYQTSAMLSSHNQWTQTPLSCKVRWNLLNPHNTLISIIYPHWPFSRPQPLLSTRFTSVTTQ
jgi:hypothetical protein